jgi:DNA-binding NarL/FixJ family response regulator
MLTLRGVFKDGRITFSDKVPFSGEHQVLVTFLDAEDGILFVSEEKRSSLVELIRESGLLTPRELEALQLAQRGMQTKDIADKLGLSDGTVRNRFSSIYSKLKVSNRSQAIRKAVELGLLSPLKGLQSNNRNSDRASH